MKTRTIVLSGAFGLAMLLSVNLAAQEGKPGGRDVAPVQKELPQRTSGQAATNADTFEIDPVHTTVIFKIQHMGVSNFYGRFNDVTGSVGIDAANPTNDSLVVQVKAASLDTNNKQRDRDVTSPSFFNATEFPTISFKSTKVAKAGDGYAVTGDLTFHGVTKPITVNLTLNGPKQTPMGNRVGFETTFTIKRTDYGIDTYVANGGLGDEVQITVSGEGVKK